MHILMKYNFIRTMNQTGAVKLTKSPVNSFLFELEGLTGI